MLIVNIITTDFIIKKKVKTRDYTIIFALSKILLQYNSVFFLYILQNKVGIFSKYLVYITIDKAYLI